MITLTIQCARCSKEVSHNVTDQTLNGDMVRKFGFGHAHNGKTNVILCNACERQYSDLQDRLEIAVKQEMCDFFDNCEGEENGRNGGTKNG